MFKMFMGTLKENSGIFQPKPYFPSMDVLNFTKFFFFRKLLQHGVHGVQL